MNKKVEIPVGPVYSLWGAGELLEVFEDKVTITPKGLSGFIRKGVKGAKTIMFYSISAIQLKRAGLLSGYIQFTVPGGIESKGGAIAAASDENTFVFPTGNALVKEIKDYIEKRIQELRRPQAPPSSVSVADEIQKLADMLTKGILTEEEFQAAKRRLIG